MNLTLPGKRAKKGQAEVGLAEVHFLWHMVKAKNDFLECLEVYQSFTHDKDLLALEALFAREIRGDIQQLEQQLRKHAVRGPDGYAPATNAAAEKQLFRDQAIAAQVLIFAQEHIKMLIKAFRTCTTDDKVSALFMKFIKEAANRLALIIKYVRLKGWIGKQPMYPFLPQSANEAVCAGEAYFLWDHMTFRNDNIELTQTLLSFAHDADFKLFLENGHRNLVKQARMLEKELKQFGIPIPNRPPGVMPTTGKSHLMEDDSMFRWVFTGMQGALSMHAEAMRECSFNDRIYNLFRDLLFSELEMFHASVKLGKLKGWLNPAPTFST